MRPQGYVTSVRSEKILRWKLGLGCRFGNDEEIYIFHSIFFVFFFFVLHCFVFLVFFFNENVLFYFF